MATKRKSAKKKSRKTAARVKTITIFLNKTFKPDPLKLKNGDLLKIVSPNTADVDIEAILDIGKGSGGGGAIVIHS